MSLNKQKLSSVKIRFGAMKWNNMFVQLFNLLRHTVDWNIVVITYHDKHYLFSFGIIWLPNLNILLGMLNTEARWYQLKKMSTHKRNFSCTHAHVISVLWISERKHMGNFFHHLFYFLWDNFWNSFTISKLYLLFDRMLFWVGK